MSYNDLTDALCRPDAYAHPAQDVVHLHTHISDIFLVGDYAYKVKKPVNFGFLDFSTLDKRLHACREEVRLNARLAPDVYLGTATVRFRAGRYSVIDGDDQTGGAPDTIVDYAVRMLRMPQEGMLDRVARDGRLTRAHMRNIARQLADFHRAAERGPRIERHATPENVALPIRQNFDQTEKYIGRCITRAQFDALRTYSEAFLGAHTGLFESRIAERRIVDGHGDLHLRNMCWYRNRVVIFDCIEFSLALRAGDVISDIAFLTMDLDARGLAHLGNVFLNAYLELTGDYGGVALLDFYQTYRACVRGKVTAFLLDAADTEAERTAAQGAAAGYFAQAGHYIAPRAAGLIVTCGLSGSGKSTAAHAAAETLAGVVVRSDAVRKRLAGMDPTQRDESGFAQGIYNPSMTQATYASMLRHAADITAAGRWAILDATYPTVEYRRAVSDLAHALGLPFVILHCSAPRAELLRRLALRRAAGTDVSDATGAILDEQTRHFQAPTADEGKILQWDGTQDIALLVASLAR